MIYDKISLMQFMIYHDDGKEPSIFEMYDGWLFIMLSNSTVQKFFKPKRRERKGDNREGKNIHEIFGRYNPKTTIKK